MAHTCAQKKAGVIDRDQVYCLVLFLALVMISIARNATLVVIMLNSLWIGLEMDLNDADWWGDQSTTPFRHCFPASLYVHPTKIYLAGFSMGTDVIDILFHKKAHVMGLNSYHRRVRSIRRFRFSIRQSETG